MSTIADIVLRSRNGSIVICRRLLVAVGVVACGLFVLADAMARTSFGDIDWRVYQHQARVVAGKEEIPVMLGGRTTVLYPAMNVVVHAQPLTKSSREHITEVAQQHDMQVFSQTILADKPLDVVFFSWYSSSRGDIADAFTGVVNAITWPGTRMPAYTTGTGLDLLVPSCKVLVRVREGVSQRAIGPRLLAEAAATTLTARPELGNNVLAVCLRTRAKALGLSRTFSQDPDVLWSEPDFYRRIHFNAVPNDPLFPQQQYLQNTGQNDAVAGSDVDALRAWEISRGAADIVIAIVDDGVDIAHPDLRIAPGGYDFLQDNDDPSPEGFQAHGTGCAGVAAAINNNDYLISGVAPDCSILPVRIAGDDGFVRDSVQATAIRHAAQYADIINLSWGWPGDADSSVVREAVDFAVAEGRDGKGCPVFAAVGNTATDWHIGFIPLSGIELPAGRYSFSFSYSPSLTGGWPRDRYWGINDDTTVMLDNIRLLCGNDQYTVLWMEQFEGEEFPPEGWDTTGDYPWERTDKNSYRGAGGQYSAKAGRSSDSMLYAPLLALDATETLMFAFRAVAARFTLNILDEYGGIIFSRNLESLPVQTHIMRPAMYENVMAVGALTDRDVRADYSCYGHGLDIMASSCGGINSVVTLDAMNSIGYNNANYFPFFGGTSAATPLAAGIAGLLLATDRELTAVEIYHQMRQSCEKVGDVTYNVDMPAGAWHEEYGYGLVNAYNVLTMPMAPPRTAVPDITEVNVEHAKATIKRNHLTVGEIAYQHHDTLAQDLVISQEPAPKKHVDVDASVDMVVSLGRVQSEIPNIVGMEEDAALQRIRTAGFTVGFITHEFCKDTRRGMVCVQCPEPGVFVAEGQYIDFTVSRGRRLRGVLGCREMQHETGGTSLFTDISVAVLLILCLRVSSWYFAFKRFGRNKSLRGQRH